jgi:hypothetical protein
MLLGTYTLTQTLPVGLEFSHWECYDVTSGKPVRPTNTSSVSLTDGEKATCVAVYLMAQNPRYGAYNNQWHHAMMTLAYVV